MTNKVNNYAEPVIFWLASNFVGLMFILLGVLATLSISEKAADTCNIWSLFYILGLMFASYADLYGKIARRSTPKNVKRHRCGWKFTIEFAWMLVSAVFASVVSNWMWIDRVPEMLEFSTNGCSLFVMGITSFMLYFSYTE